jgi:hypothetical protein
MAAVMSNIHASVEGDITHDDLSEALGLGFHQIQQLIKEHGAGDDFTLAEFESERAALQKMERR